MNFAEKYGYVESDKKIGTVQEPTIQSEATEPAKDGGFSAFKEQNKGADRAQQSSGQDNSFSGKFGYVTQKDFPDQKKDEVKRGGFIKESFRSLAGGGLDAVEQYARATRALPGGPETYNLDPDSRPAKAISLVDNIKKENPEYDLDEKREGLSRWYHEGLRAMVPSLAGGLPGAAVGAAIGSVLPVGGTFLGGLAGFALGAGGVFGAAEYDSFMEEAQQAGVPEEEAHQMGVLSGIAEGGFEAATDLLQGATLGVGKLATAPAKQALKKGVSELFKMRFGNILGRSVGGAAIEGTGEAATAATQTKLRQELGMTEMSAMDAAAHAFGPGFMMGLMFTPMVQYANYKSKKQDAFALAREDTPADARKKAAERIGKQLGKHDKRAERYWMKYADEAIKNKEPIRLDMDYDTLNERINNLESSAQYSEKAKDNLEILKDQKALIDEEENQKDQIETAQKDQFQETPETEDYTQPQTTTTLADFDLGQPVDQEVVGSEMEQTTEQTALTTADVAIEAGQSQRSESANDYISEPLSTPERDEQGSTYTNAPMEEMEASQEPVQETSLLDVRDEDLEVIDGTEEELGNYNIIGPSKKPGQGYKRLDSAKKRAQKLKDEGADTYLMKNREGEYLVVSDRKYAETKEEPVPLRKDQVETEIRTEIGNQFDTLQKRGLLEIVDNETDASGEPIYANGSDKPAGYYENGKITLVSSGIGKGQAYNVFMHEGVHKILDKNKSFNKRKKSLFNEFKNLKDTENIKAAYGVVPKDTKPESIDEEAFAYFIQNENNRNHSLYRKTVATVKSYLNKLGIPYTKLNDKDIAALAVKQINKDMGKQVKPSDRKYSKVAGSDQKQADTDYNPNAQTMADVLGGEYTVKQPAQAQGDSLESVLSKVNKDKQRTIKNLVDNGTLRYEGDSLFVVTREVEDKDLPFAEVDAHMDRDGIIYINEPYTLYSWQEYQKEMQQGEKGRIDSQWKDIGVPENTYISIFENEQEYLENAKAHELVHRNKGHHHTENPTAMDRIRKETEAYVESLTPNQFAKLEELREMFNGRNWFGDLSDLPPLKQESTVKQPARINVDSRQTGLEYALTNPTHTSPRGYKWTKGDKATREYLSDGIEYNGKKYADVEAAYQKNKDRTESKSKPTKENSNNYKLMVDLVEAKLRKYNRLVSGIDNKGGEQYLQNIVHQPTSRNSVWETGGQDWFKSALTDAYKKVKGNKDTVKQPELPTEAQTPAEPTVGMDSQIESLTEPALTFADKPVQTEKTVSVKDTATASSTVVTTSKSIDRSIPKEEVRYNQVAAIVEGAANADEVVLFGELNDDQTLPKGLGAWAAQTAIDQRTPVYLFDNKKNKWFTYKKGRPATPETIEAQKREIKRERGAANTGKYEMIGGETLPDRPIPKQEEIVDGFTESIPPRIPTDNTFLYADSKYIDQGNVKQAISRIETEEANRDSKDKTVTLPPSIDAEVNSPAGKQAQLQKNSENTIREMKRDFYGSRGDSEVADNMDADQMDTEYGNEESIDLPELTPEQVEQLEDDVPGNKRSAANVADILRDYSNISRDDNLSVFEQIEKPQGFEKLRTIGGIKREIREKFFNGKDDTDLTADEAYVVHLATENIRQTNEKIIKGLYDQMLAAKSNTFLNKKWNDMEPHKDYESFRNTLRIVTTRDYIASQLVELSKFYDLSTTTDYFAENTFTDLDSVPNELLDLYEYRDQIRQIAREEELDISTDEDFKFDVEQASKQLLSDEFGILLDNLKRTNPKAQQDYGDIFKALLTDETTEGTVNFFKNKIDPLIEAATEDATDANGGIKYSDFVETEAWYRAKGRIQKRYGLESVEAQDDRDLLKIAAFISKDRKFNKVSDLVESKPFETYDTEENYLEKIFPATAKEKKEGKTTLERKTDKVKIADRAAEYVDMLVEGMRSWGFKKTRHIKLNINSPSDAVIMMKNPDLLKDFQNATFEGVFNSLNDNQKKHALRIIENSLPDAKIAKLKKELSKPANQQQLDGVFGSMQNKLTARDIAGAVKSEYFKGEKGKRFKQFGPNDRVDIAQTMLQSMKLAQDIWYKPLFGHGLPAETVTELDQAQIDNVQPDNSIGRVEEINTRRSIAYADNYGYIQNFDYTERLKEVAGLVETLGIAKEGEVELTLKTLADGDYKSKEHKDAENRIQEWKIEIAKRSVSSGMFINSGKIDELSKKYRLDKNKVKRTWLTSVDTQDFYRKVDNLIDETHLETAKQNVSKRLGNTDTVIETDLNRKLTENFDEKQKQAYYSGKKYIGDRRKQMAVKAAVELRNEILLRGRAKARIEDIKLSNEQEINISDVVELRDETDFDKQFTKDGALPVRMLNQDKQAAYESIAKAFGAELVLISDARFDELTGKPTIRSRYIPATKDSASQFVINIKDKRPFDNLFSDMVADHVLNSMSKAQIKRLNGRAKRTSIQNQYGNAFDRTVSEQAEKKGDYLDDKVRLDAISELIANVISNKQTLNEIASTYEGRADLVAILNSVTQTINKLDNPIHRTRGLDADTVGAFSKDSFEQYRKFIVELFVDEDVMARGHDYQNMTSTEPRMYSMNGFYSVADAQEMLKQVRQGGKEQFKKITQDNRGTKVAIMDAVEKWLKNAVLWIKKHKPTGFIDDLLADPLDMELASMVQHAGEERLAYLRAGVIARHKDTFKQFSITELEQMHDRIRRGIRFNNKGVGEKVDNGLDFTKEEDINKALEEGISQEVIDAFIDFKKEADRQYQELRKVYPDLPEDPVHYGQSIRWRYKDGRYVNDDFDQVIKDELEGSDYYTKEKDKSRTTQDIALKYQYKSINPTTMLLDYVAETEKIIATRKMLNRAMAEGRAKIFTNPYDAKKAKLHEVDDVAFQNVLNHQTEAQYEIELNGNPYLDENGGRIFFKTVAEAEETAKGLDGITSVTKRESLDKALVGWTIYEEVVNGLIEVGAVNDMPYAKDIVNKMQEAGIQAVMKPRFEASQKTTLAQTYFSEDLARMLRTIVSPNKFRNMKLGPLSGHSLLQFKHASTAIEFAFSFFHAFTIAQEAMASEMSIRQRRANTWGEKIRASNPFSALGQSLSHATDLKVLIGEVMKNPEMVHDKAIVDKIGEILHIDNPDVADMIHHFFNVGGLFEMDKNERHSSHYFGEMRYLKNLPKMEIVNGKAEIVKGNNSLLDVAKTMVASVAETRDELVRQYPDKKVANMFKTAQFAALEGPTAWLMETGIPKIKMATWMKEYSKNIEINREKLLNGEISKMSIAHDTMKFVEDRFGEVNWKNQWMNKGTKDALIFIFRSFTWFTGSWKGVTKAGVDYGKLGWYKLKGENYELTTKGLWGINAVIAHFLTAAAVTAVYQAVYGWDDPTPDDEETDLLTKLMFPRHDPQDPHSRLTIPSYVTEAYKIFHHIGLMGDHTEPFKLISGRFNSFIGNAWEAFDGKSWDGVVVRDSSESLPKQGLDSALHIINIAPISISSAFSNAARKGFDPTTTALSLMGMTRAPAISLHSDAVNKAYQLSREQFAGLSKEPGEKRLLEERSRAAYQFGQGNKKPLQDMLKEGRISQTQYENSIKGLRYIDGKKNPHYKDELTSALKRLTIEDAIEVWNYMSDAEKKEQRVELVNKYRNVVKRGTRPKQEIARIRQELKVSGIF